MTNETEWVLVPRVATDDMLDAGHNVLCERHKAGSFGECPGHGWGDADACYTAMLSSAPTPLPAAGAVAKLLEAAQAFPEEPNPYTYRMAYAKLRAALESFAGSAPVSGWQPIETAPHGLMILCADMHAREARHWAFVGWRHGESADGCVTTPERVNRPCTNWMPLPPPPAKESV